jgi:GT2 family glycosyltransferase/cephalosporin hydroxylase
MNKKTVFQLYEDHVGKVSDKWFLYLNEYNRLLAGYQDRPVRLLEIGIQNGGSLEILSCYFSKAEKIIGCDIDQRCEQLRFDDNRISIVVGDANSDDCQQLILQQSASFDIIVDDGSHKSSDIVRAFARYFPYLNDGGVYVVEDLHCSYWADFEGGIYNPLSSVAFFKRLADVVNFEHWRNNKSRNDLLKGFVDHFDVDFNDYDLARIHSIEFINSLCIIRKSPPEENVIGKRFVVGSEGFSTNGWQRLNATSILDVSMDKMDDGSLDVFELGNKVTELGNKVTERDESIDLLNRQLFQIVSSNSWRITLPLREAHLWLSFPKQQVKKYVRGGVNLAKRKYQSLPLSYQTKQAHRETLVKYLPRLLLISGSPSATVQNSYRMSNGISSTMRLLNSLRRYGFVRAGRRMFELVHANGFSYTAEKVVRHLKKSRDMQFINPNIDFNKLQDKANNEALNYCINNQHNILIVIPSYNDRGVLEACLHSIYGAESKVNYRVIICDDNSPDVHKQWLSQMALQYTWLSVCFGEKNIGFAGNVNRGLSAAIADEHVVLLNSDTIVSNFWLDNLVFSSFLKDADIVCGKLVYPNRDIQYYGGMRNPIESDWFMHNHHMERLESTATCFEQYTLYATGACMYITSRALTKLGQLDEQYGMAFEDVDYSLRAWQKHLKVSLAPFCIVTHFESVTRSRVQGTRELNSKAYFWEKNANFFKRNVISKKTGTPKIIYVTQDCGVGGGHRFIFQHITALHKLKFDVELWTLDTKPNWYNLDENIPFKIFGDYSQLTKELSEENAIKVATWWETAEHVWVASSVNGIPAYYVQDIESSYYVERGELLTAAKVDSMYMPEFKYLTYATWIKDKLELDFKRPAECVGFYLDQDRFYRDNAIKKKQQILVFARGEPLKNFEYTKKILSKIQALNSKYTVVAVGPDESLVKDIDGCIFVRTPSDQELNKLYNESIAIIQTSTHEGLSLPPLEGMLCECLVFCTDAFGNRAYIEPGINCVLLPSNDAGISASAIVEALSDSAENQRNNMINNAFNTAMKYQVLELETNLSKFYLDVASKEYGVYYR